MFSFFFSSFATPSRQTSATTCWKDWSCSNLVYGCILCCPILPCCRFKGFSWDFRFYFFFPFYSFSSFFFFVFFCNYSFLDFVLVTIPWQIWGLWQGNVCLSLPFLFFFFYCLSFTVTLSLILYLSLPFLAPINSFFGSSFFYE